MKTKQEVGTGVTAQEGWPGWLCPPHLNKDYWVTSSSPQDLDLLRGSCKLVR